MVVWNMLRNMQTETQIKHAVCKGHPLHIQLDTGTGCVENTISVAIRVNSQANPCVLCNPRHQLPRRREM